MWLNLTNIILRKKSQVQTVQTLWFLLCEVKKKKKGKAIKNQDSIDSVVLGEGVARDL